MDIFDRIEYLLKETKKSKRGMCFALDMPYSTISSMFQRRSKNLDVPTAKKMAQYLGTTLEYLVTGNEAYRSPESIPDNNLSLIEQRLINYFRQLSPIGQGEILGFVQALIKKEEESKE